jgi:HSP20 family molecular chaperone IbpA
MTNNLTNTLRGAMAPWFLGDLDGFVTTANQMRDAHAKNSYPPHNVFKLDENTIVLQMALAGIDPADLKMVSNGNMFTISYEPKPDDSDVSTQYKSISTRKFKKSFRLEEPWDVSSATLNNGLLEVTVSHFRLPEKEIEIKVTV